MNRSIIGIVLTVIAFAIGMFVLRPKMAEVKAINIDKKAKLEQVKQKEARRDALRTLSSTFTQDKSRIDSLISALPEEPQIPEVLVTIEAMTRDNGVGVESISPQVDTTKHSVSVSLAGTADLAALERLFRAVSENNRPMSVSTVSMTRNQENNSIAYNLVVTFPYVNTEADTGALTTPAAGASSGGDSLE